jgi:FAD/FMN-containing dehydrogenase/Fe-S oxidoreductase
MIPRLNLVEKIKPNTVKFLEELAKTPFQGEIRADFASRLITSTDNSIYQVLPQGVVFPHHAQDLVHLFRLANQPPFKQITFVPRGGGTGTNGQSLSTGIAIDCSKHMNQILELNLEESWVRVQPGVVLDCLNLDLQPYGVFFAPTVAPSDRATIGGMINTDACGKGSRIYGRTSDHILELTWVLANGTVGSSQPVDTETLKTLKQDSSCLGKIYGQVDQIVTSKRDLIEQTFPKMPRFMTGYNLAKVYSQKGDTFDLNRILAGSEGTLAVITEAKLKLTKIPNFKQLLVIHYNCFNDALLATEALLKLEPAAIETIDEKILDLAKQDEIYPRVREFIADAKVINLVEFAGDNLDQLQGKISQLVNITESNKHQPQQATGSYWAQNKEETANLWALRKKGVGLLGNKKGERKPIPFIEDTAVPPSCLFSYIREFKALLTEYHLDYAMYGHVDVGCLHVRPALDMKVPKDEVLIRELSDKVVALVSKYGGVMWAEHGKGFRSEYTPVFFGEELYQDLRRIKAAFDPENRLNPGKIVTPSGTSAKVARLETPLRGHFDRQVPAAMRSEYEVAFSCNGNGACFNFHPDHVMCPSYKGMSDRIHSPKGRASLLREWLRQLAVTGRTSQGGDCVVVRYNSRGVEGGTISALQEPRRPSSALTLRVVERGQGQPLTKTDNWEVPASFPIRAWNTLTKVERYDYSHEVYKGMHGCLSCKACATQCPIHVDIPSLKAKFLELYYTRYLRPWRDYLFGNIETLAHWQSSAPRLVNAFTQNPVTRWSLKQFLGMVDPPELSSLTLQQGLLARKAPAFDLNQLSILTQAEKANSAILLQDAFTSFYESQLVLDTYDFLRQLGYTVYVLPFFASGKPLQVLGFLKKFQAIARENAKYLSEIGKLGIPIIGIEPSIVLTYRDEYIKMFDSVSLPSIQLLQEFLLTQSQRILQVTTSAAYYLLGHCTEKTLALASQQQWQKVFQAMGIPLTLVSTGCCGMAGIYGHETEHYELSRGIYQMSWEQHLPSTPEERKYFLVTGYSCRSQVKRFAGWIPSHPIQALLSHVKNVAN